MSQGMKIANGALVAARLITKLTPGCENIMAAGSIRRGVHLVGDIQLVAIPSPIQSGLFPDKTRTALDQILEDIADFLNPIIQLLFAISFNDYVECQLKASILTGQTILDLSNFFLLNLSSGSRCIL